MKRIIVNITDDLTQIPNLDELLPKEFAAATKLQEQGILEHLFLKDDKTGAVLVFKDVDEAKAKELVSQFPMFQHFQQVEYIVVDKQY